MWWKWLLLGLQLGTTSVFLLWFYLDNKDKKYTKLQLISFVPIMLAWEFVAICGLIDFKMKKGK